MSSTSTQSGIIFFPSLLPPVHVCVVSLPCSTDITVTVKICDVNDNCPTFTSDRTPTATVSEVSVCDSEVCVCVCVCVMGVVQISHL